MKNLAKIFFILFASNIFAFPIETLRIDQDKFMQEINNCIQRGARYNGAFCVCRDGLKLFYNDCPSQIAYSRDVVGLELTFFSKALQTGKLTHLQVVRDWVRKLLVESSQSKNSDQILVERLGDVPVFRVTNKLLGAWFIVNIDSHGVVEIQLCPLSKEELDPHSPTSQWLQHYTFDFARDLYLASSEEHLAPHNSVGGGHMHWNKTFFHHGKHLLAFLMDVERHRYLFDDFPFFKGTEEEMLIKKQGDLFIINGIAVNSPMQIDTTVRQLQGIRDSKWMVFNFQSLVTKETLEFRGHRPWQSMGEVNLIFQLLKRWIEKAMSPELSVLKEEDLIQTFNWEQKVVFLKKFIVEELGLDLNLYSELFHKQAHRLKIPFLISALEEYMPLAKSLEVEKQYQCEAKFPLVEVPIKNILDALQTQGENLISFLDVNSVHDSHHEKKALRQQLKKLTLRPSSEPVDFQFRYMLRDFLNNDREDLAMVILKEGMEQIPQYSAKENVLKVREQALYLAWLKKQKKFQKLFLNFEKQVGDDYFYKTKGLEYFLGERPDPSFLQKWKDYFFWRNDARKHFCVILSTLYNKGAYSEIVTALIKNYGDYESLKRCSIQKRIHFLNYIPSGESGIEILQQWIDDGEMTEKDLKDFDKKPCEIGPVENGFVAKLTSKYLDLQSHGYYSSQLKQPGNQLKKDFFISVAKSRNEAFLDFFFKAYNNHSVSHFDHNFLYAVMGDVNVSAAFLERLVFSPRSKFKDERILPLFTRKDIHPALIMRLLNERPTLLERVEQNPFVILQESKNSYLFKALFPLYADKIPRVVLDKISLNSP